MNKLNIKKNLPYIVTIIMTAIIVVLSISAAYGSNRFTHMLIQEKLSDNVNGLYMRLEQSRINTRAAAISMSDNPYVVKAIRERDREEIIRVFTASLELFQINYYTITDAEGIVLARTHEPGEYGDSVTGQRNIQNALKGQVSSYYEPGTVVKVSVRTGAPVYDTDGTLIGVISAGFRFDTNETADNMKQMLGTDVSVFYGEERVATTITQDGERAVGTILSPEVSETVYEHRNEFVGEIELFGVLYETYYKPLFDADDEVFAVIVLGIPIDHISSQANTRLLEVILIAFSCIVIAIILLRALRSMDAANKAKSQFLATMSHEIRTPMNAIIGITEIQLQKNDEIDDETKIALEKIHASGELLLGIINDILDLSKIEAGKLELFNAEYELASLISDTSQLNMMRIGSKKIDFELNVNKNVPVRVIGDELRVKQILNNLLSNAFKYTNQGTVKLSIRSEIVADVIKLIFTIEDTGQGMSEEQINKLFDEYSRFNTEANRKTEGTGLGMTITRNLLRLMDGDITVRSQPGKGSRFTVTIPQGIVDSAVLGEELVENLHRFRTSHMKMKRMQILREYMPYGNVLIVDDVETNIYVAKGLLAPYGLNIDSAESGYEAIEKIKHGAVYDIVFMDHMMPEMDGIEATKNIRQMGYYHPIIALTANAVAGQSDIFLGSGFNDFISKPIDMRQMNTLLNKYIRDKQSEEVIRKARKKAEEIAKQNNEAVLKNKSRTKKEKAQAIKSLTEAFIRDAKKSIEVLEAILAKEGKYEADDLRKFTIHVHGIKSASANIGEMDISAAALKLESLGREENSEEIAKQAPAFMTELKALVEKLTPDESAADDAADISAADKQFLQGKLDAIIKACEDFDIDTVDGIVDELETKKWPKPVNELLQTVSEHILHSDFDVAGEAVKEYLSKQGK